MNTKQKQLIESYIKKQVRQLLKEEKGYRFQNLGGGIDSVFIKLGGFKNTDIIISPTLYSTSNEIKIPLSDNLKNKISLRYKDEKIDKEVDDITLNIQNEILELISKELKRTDEFIGKGINKIVAKYNK